MRWEAVEISLGKVGISSPSTPNSGWGARRGGNEVALAEVSSFAAVAFAEVVGRRPPAAAAAVGVWFMAAHPVEGDHPHSSGQGIVS